MKSILNKGIMILITLIILLSMVGIQPAPVVASEADQVVYPTGDHPQDYQNVQTALDNGGTILLKAVDDSGVPTPFNFGPPELGSGGVFFTTDAVLLGEVQDSYRTVIQGGSFPVRSFSPVHITIRDIHFDGPYASAIIIGNSVGTEIAGNKITNVVGSPQAPGIRKAVGIWVNGISPEDISGEMTIENNIIHNLDAEIGDGIALIILAADATIIGNDIRGVDTQGILVNGNTSPVRIERNVIIPGPGFYPGTSSGNGILAGHFFPVEPQAPVYIHKNTIICENPFADGIGLFESDGSHITQNQIFMQDVFFGGISLADGASNTYIGQNRLMGAGSFAFDILFIGLSEDPLSKSNSFVGNNITDFQSLFADVFLDVNSRDTIFEGFCRSVIDLGEGNQIQCNANKGLSKNMIRQIIQAREIKREIFETFMTFEAKEFSE